MPKYQSVQFFLETFGTWQFFMTLAGIKSKKRNFFKNDTLAASYFAIVSYMLKTYLAEVAIRAEVAKNM